MTNNIHLIDETDNRDLTTTILSVDNGTRVEVNPMELFVNAVENAESDGPVYAQLQKCKCPDGTWVLKLCLTFSTDEEHDEDGDTHIVDIVLQNEPQIFGEDYT